MTGVQTCALPISTIGFRAHLAGELNGAAKQQQLFSQRRLAGVGVRDDREGASARDGVRVSHGLSVVGKKPPT